MRFYFFPMFYGLLIINLIGLVPCPVMGQVLTKKALTPADYMLWGTMGAEHLSENGNWVSYRMAYEQSMDTVFVMQTKTKKKLAFAGISDWRFAKEPVFAYKENDVLKVFNLVTAHEISFSKVKRYDFSATGEFLITLENESTLVVRRNGHIVDVIEHVTDYEWHTDGSSLIYTSSENGKGTVGILRFNEGYLNYPIIKPTLQTFGFLKWSQNGNSVGFYGVDNGNETLYCYDLQNAHLFELKSTDKNFPKDLRIAPNRTIELKISEDGNKVFFGITPIKVRDTSSLSSDVEVWNSFDRKIYRERKLMASVPYLHYLAVWHLDHGTVTQLSTETYSWFALNGDKNFALIADPHLYEPQYKWISDKDYYLLNITTGEKELLLEAQSGYDEQLNFSPDGRFISYYKEKNWWVYDIVKKSHTMVTKDIPVSWDNSIVDQGNELRVWGQAGWTTDGTYLLCYDYHDIWAISTDGKQHKRLTQGKEQQLQFRLHHSAISNLHEFNYSENGTRAYDLTKSIVLTVYDTKRGEKGYYIMQAHKSVVPLVMQDASITKYQKALSSDAFIYVLQRFNQPPSLVFQDGTKSSVLVTSNTHHKQYQMGSSKMIYYTDSKGTPLKGALFYPEDYDVTKKYPMVVSIYESLSSSIHDYVNPSLHDGIGFNIAHMVAAGYMVLLPDISYVKGNTGMSAVDCVTAAVSKVLELGFVDPKKVGLIGQSFGGYETNFIITQTHLFSAAVSGSAVSDIIQHYFTINTHYHTIDGWRYENQQYRIGNSFYENQEAYYQNSPLLNASKINTPLLSWAGKLDENIQPKQAETFYAALRRLKKPHIMLVYASDGHIFYNRKNQEDLTLKITDWFGHYLKGKPKSEWMKRDIGG